MGEIALFKTLEATNYFGTFVGNFAATGAGYSFIDTILTALMVLFTGAALFVAWRAWKISKAGQWREILSTYFKEYRTYEMGKAVSDLWTLRRICNDNIQNFVLAYVDDCVQSTRFHFNTRRRVSAFYQEIAVLCKKNKYLRTIVYSLWTKGDLEIIPAILLPIETIAIPLAARFKELTEEQRKGFVLERVEDNEIQYRDTWAPVFKHMYDLWEKAPLYRGNEP
jgi:hypothetical protein